MPATRTIVGVAVRVAELGLALGVDGTADMTLGMCRLHYHRVVGASRDFDFCST